MAAGTRRTATPSASSRESGAPVGAPPIATDHRGDVLLKAYAVSWPEELGTMYWSRPAVVSWMPSTLKAPATSPVARSGTIAVHVSVTAAGLLFRFTNQGPRASCAHTGDTAPVWSW